jgi:hypothetical protein
MLISWAADFRWVAVSREPSPVSPVVRRGHIVNAANPGRHADVHRAGEAVGAVAEVLPLEQVLPQR